MNQEQQTQQDSQDTANPNAGDDWSSTRVGVFGKLKAAVLALRDPNTPILGKLGIIAIGVGALLVMVAYGISPIDLLPEALLGPFGLVDDVILIPTLLFVLSLFMPRRTAIRILRYFGKGAKARHHRQPPGS